LKFDTHQCRASFLVCFLHVFESGDIVCWSKDFVYELFQRAWSLRETDEEVVFQAFILQGTFPDFGHAVDVVVAAADDTNDFFSADGFGVVVECGDGKCSGRFYDDGILIVQFEDGGADTSFGDQVHFIQDFPADGKGEVSYAFDRSSVHESVDVM
jgi:hypothetical protein